MAAARDMRLLGQRQRTLLFGAQQAASDRSLCQFSSPPSPVGQWEQAKIDAYKCGGLWYRGETLIGLENPVFYGRE